jgi:hypothetical protein
MPQYPVFRGNCPRNVAKDAKYGVRSSPKGPVIALTYSTTDDERWYMTTEAHPALVAMVNGVKTAQGNPPNGSFYVNEYKQVIVPVTDSDLYYLAGTYDKPLRFEFEGKTLSGEPLTLDGDPLSPGDEWIGPRPGIPYVLCAGGQDIKYTISPRPNVERTVLLSKQVGPERALQVAALIRAIKGHSGGRFYVNEWRVIFTRIEEASDWRYVYIGRLDPEESWFTVVNTPTHSFEP